MVADHLPRTSGIKFQKANLRLSAADPLIRVSARNPNGGRAVLRRWRLLGYHVWGYLISPPRPSPRGPENSATAKPANHEVAGFDQLLGVDLTDAY